MRDKKQKQGLLVLKLIGFAIVAFGITVQFADLKGYLKNRESQKILDWVLYSKSGMPLESPAAREFIKKFPPPNTESVEDLTHLTKSVMQYETGGLISANVNYMRKDLSRTGHVATLEEIRRWTSETPYPWISWWITILGFLALLVTFYLERRQTAHNKSLHRLADKSDSR
ncbi:MAG: hypothetical protein KJ663_03530 [Proteobacteria bacterium]|nr:hypothetical protein [Pseudomonadota bacterium]